MKKITFNDQYIIVERVIEEYNIIGAELCLQSRYKYVENAEFNIAGNKILEEIKILKSLASNNEEINIANEYEKIYK